MWCLCAKKRERFTHSSTPGETKHTHIASLSQSSCALQMHLAGTLLRDKVLEASQKVTATALQPRRIEGLPQERRREIKPFSMDRRTFCCFSQSETRTPQNNVARAHSSMLCFPREHGTEKSTKCRREEKKIVHKIQEWNEVKNGGKRWDLRERRQLRRSDG